MCHHLDAGELGEMLVVFGSHFERKPELGGIAFKLDWQLLLTTVSMGFLRKFPQSAQWGWASGKPASNGKHFRWHIAVILSAKLPLDEEEMCWTLSWATVFGLWLRTLNSKWIAPG